MLTRRIEKERIMDYPHSETFCGGRATVVLTSPDEGFIETRNLAAADLTSRELATAEAQEAVLRAAGLWNKAVPVGNNGLMGVPVSWSDMTTPDIRALDAARAEAYMSARAWVEGCGLTVDDEPTQTNTGTEVWTVGRD